MNKFYCKKFFLLIVFLVFSGNSVYSQKFSTPAITKKVEYSKTRDEQIEKALRLWRGNDDSDKIRYHYNKVDLNGDGKLDAIVFVSGNSLCGTGGCNMLIFKNLGARFQLITEMSVSHPPLIVLSIRNKGWNDLAMFVSGGGIKTYCAILKFNGKSYPENPTDEPAIPRTRRIEGVEYLSGIDRIDTGFELK